MNYRDSISGQIKKIFGPFRHDVNISNIFIFLDHRAWIINRPAVGELNDGKEYGVIEFEDVRAYRTQVNGSGFIVDDEDMESTTAWWAVEITNSRYLQECIEHDPQRTKESLSNHSHYIVLDGHNRMFEIIARRVTTRIINSSVGISLEVLFQQEQNIFE